MKNLKVTGGKVINPDPQSVQILAPTAQHAAAVHSGALDPNSSETGGAILVHKDRNPDIERVKTCIKCGKGQDIVIVIGFPAEDGHPLMFCRHCVSNRPVGRPLIVDFKS